MPSADRQYFQQAVKASLRTHQIGFFWTPHPSTSRTAKLLATRPEVMFVQMPGKINPTQPQLRSNNLT
jgi:hypothetical protein